MKCSKCDRENSEERSTCMYCGESLTSEAQPDDRIAVSDGVGTTLHQQEGEETKGEALPDTVELNVMDIPHNESLKDAEDEESIPKEIVSDDDDFIENQAEMTQERALSLLKGMKDSFDKGHLKDAEYDKLVLEIVKDYILPMDDKTKINFIANGIVNSEFYAYLNETIHKDLKTFVINYVAGK